MRHHTNVAFALEKLKLELARQDRELNEAIAEHDLDEAHLSTDGVLREEPAPRLVDRHASLPRQTLTLIRA